MRSCLSAQVLGSRRGSLIRAMSYHHSSQLWSSQLGVRFGPLANIRSEQTSSSPLHTSALSVDEARTDNPVNPTQLGIFSTPISLPPRSTSPRRAPIALPPRSTSLHRPPIALPVPDGATDTTETSLTESVTAPSDEREKIVEPPSTTLEFTISKEEFIAARAAKSHWSYNMYHRIGKDGKIDNVKVHYCESKATTERVCKEYFMNEDVIGLDLEWMQYARRTDGIRPNVSLIQIASPSRIALIHVALFPDKEDLLGPSFRKIMENSNVSKVGVNIVPDCTRLRNHLGITVRGVFELSHLYRVVKFLPTQPKLVHKRVVSLALQVEDQLLLPLYKGQVRIGNWMRRLSTQQIDYAASDAYAGLQLYYVLEEKRKALVPCPPRPYHAELQLPIPLPEPPAPPAVEKKSDGDAAAVDPTSTTSTDATASTPKPKTRKPRNSRPKIQSPKASSSKLLASEASASGESAPEPPKKKSKQRLPKAQVVRDARIIAAEAEAKVYFDAHIATHATWPTTTPVRLRAYYIWHRNEDLCPADIAALLRDPPLLTSTVAAYIVDAIQTEKFPYPTLRLHEEVVCHIDLQKSYMQQLRPTVEACSEAVLKLKRDEGETKQM